MIEARFVECRGWTVRVGGRSLSDLMLAPGGAVVPKDEQCKAVVVSTNKMIQNGGYGVKGFGLLAR